MAKWVIKKGCIINGNDETLVITITQVEEEEEVCVSDGDGYEFPEVVVELRPKAMGKFVKDHPLNELMSLFLKKEKTSLNEEEKNICIQWTYVLDDVPTRFLQLILKGFISFDHVEHFLAHFPYIFHVQPQAVRFCMELAKTEPQGAYELANLLTKRTYTITELQVIMSKRGNQAES